MQEKFDLIVPLIDLLSSWHVSQQKPRTNSRDEGWVASKPEQATSGASVHMWSLALLLLTAHPKGFGLYVSRRVHYTHLRVEAC